MSTSLNCNTAIAVKPRVDNQLIGLNDDCLVLQHFNINLSLSMGWGGVWLFWLIGLPAMVLTILSPFLPPYGYRNGERINNFFELIDGYNFLNFNYLAYFLIIFIIGGFFYAATLGFSYLNLRGIKKSCSPITFNRKEQTVSIYENGKKEEITWQKFGGRIETTSYASGYVMHTRDVVTISSLGGQTQIEASLLGESLDGKGHFSGAEALWEYIRHYMDKGPDELNVPAEVVSGINHLDKQMMYSFNFKNSLRAHLFWPLVRAKSPDNTTLFFTVLFWPIKVVFFIPNLMTDWLWRKMCLKSLKDSTTTPYYSVKDLDNLITPVESERVLVKGEDQILGNTYAEVKRRLSTQT